MNNEQLREFQQLILKLSALQGLQDGTNAAKTYLTAYAHAYEKTLLANAELLKSRIRNSDEKLSDLLKNPSDSAH
jgi:hypothetical protein